MALHCHADRLTLISGVLYSSSLDTYTYSIYTIIISGEMKSRVEAWTGREISREFFRENAPNPAQQDQMRYLSSDRLVTLGTHL